jgi:hypothetical protein
MPRVPIEEQRLTPERKRLIGLQISYCEKHDLPVAIPLSGYCARCAYDLTEHFGDHLGKQFVTGCPSCTKEYSSIMLDYSNIL